MSFLTFLCVLSFFFYFESVWKKKKKLFNWLFREFYLSQWTRWRGSFPFKVWLVSFTFLFVRRFVEIVLNIHSFLQFFIVLIFSYLSNYILPFLQILRVNKKMSKFKRHVLLCSLHFQLVQIFPIDKKRFVKYTFCFSHHDFSFALSQTLSVTKCPWNKRNKQTKKKPKEK